MSTVKIGLITTLDTNIGDDFIRYGICHVLMEIFKGDQVEFISVNKHNPYTIYPAWHPVHLREFAAHIPLLKNHAKNVIENLCSNIKFSLFDECNLIVQCGAPVFWPDCSANEWAKPLWYEIVGRLHNKIPVLNLAAGSCYPWERQPETFEPSQDAEYAKSILGYCRLTSVRDRLAKKLCASVGYDVPLVPCSAFLASTGQSAELKESGYILLNYMDGGGHFDWDQGIKSDQWEFTFKQIISSLSKRHKIAFLCHNEKEEALAQALAPELKAFCPKTPREYFACVSHAKFAICNRMHASVGLAGMGISSIAVGTDTRLLMVAELGLPVHYIKDVNANILIEETESAIKSMNAEKERLYALRAKTREMYLTAIQNVFSFA